MIKTTALLSLFLSLATLLCAQQEITFKKNTAPQSAKQDRENMYDTAHLSKLDLVEMLDMAGIRLFKFPLEGIDRGKSLYVTIDEYRQGELIKSDTLYPFPITYVYPEEETYYKDYIDGLRIFTRQEPGKLTYRIATLGMTMTGRSLEYTPDEQVRAVSPSCQYNLRRYHDQPVQYGRKTPLLVFASPWYDERIRSIRFCGVSLLTEGEKASEELIAQSPHYLLFSYEIH